MHSAQRSYFTDVCVPVNNITVGQLKESGIGPSLCKKAFGCDVQEICLQTIHAYLTIYKPYVFMTLFIMLFIL